MLDLDSLANKRALKLNEQVGDWRDTLWSPAFQKLSARMSDGEVETFLATCASVKQLQLAIQFIYRHPRVETDSPYSIMENAAGEAGLGLAQWLGSLQPSAVGGA